MEHYDATEVLFRLQLTELKARVLPYMPIPRNAHRNKTLLIQHILQNAPVRVVESLLDLGQSRPAARRRINFSLTSIPPQLPSNDLPASSAVLSRSSLPPWGHFMDLPTGDNIKDCYRDFWESTSNLALQRHICAVCARENDFVFPTRFHTCTLDEIPNKHRLTPWRYVLLLLLLSQPYILHFVRSHPAHRLVQGLLLEPRGLIMSNGSCRADICDECFSHLSKATPNTVPPLSLANNMWIGPVPECVARLSFSETLLVSLVNPHVFVFKLFPKTNLHIEPDEQQRAMRGHVISYENDVQGVSSMVEGDMLPRHPSTLSSLVRVTFIGRGKPTLDSLKSLFQVRRALVLEVLQFFHANNPYYRTLRINHGTLSLLPENDIPTEVLSIIRQSADEEVVAAESSNYVPDEQNDSVNNDGTSHSYSLLSLG